MRVRRIGSDAVAGGCGAVAEHCQRGVAVAADHVAQDLIIGAVFTDDHEDVLDHRRIADPCRDCDRRRSRFATGGGQDILCQIPVVVHVHLGRHHRQGQAVRNGNDVDGAEVLVGVEVVHAEFFSVRIFGRIGRRGCHAEARGADALVVGNEQIAVRRVQHDRARCIANRDHARQREGA